MLTSKLKVLFVIPTLTFGGAERVLLTLISGLDLSRFEPVLVFMSKTGALIEELPAWLRCHQLKRKGRLSFPKLIIKMARVLQQEEADVAVSFMGLANLLLLAAKRLIRVPTKVIITEHITPSQMYKSVEEPLGWAKLRFVKLLYPYADGIVAVSEGVKWDLVNHFGLSSEKITVIYDPVDLRRVDLLAQEEVDHPCFKDSQPIIISAGRLTPQKDYPTLLRAFAIMPMRYCCRLAILGEGPERIRLQNIARELGVSRDVVFLGYQSNPYKYIARSTVFVLPSRFEGFGLVLVEALALGVPVIATQCPSGPDEIIQNGQTGMLLPVGNSQAMTEGISALLADSELRKHLSTQGRLRARDFAVAKIVRRYEAYISQLT